MPPKKRCRKQQLQQPTALKQESYELLLPDDGNMDEVILAQGTVPLLSPEDLLLLQHQMTLQQLAVVAEAPPADQKKKKTKKRLSPTVATETDPVTGEWVDVRVFDRNPVSVAEAEKVEMAAVVMPGTYFVSLARKRVRGMFDLHERWLSRMSNRCSEYASIQRDLQVFFAETLAAFDHRYASYIAHPAFETIGKIRRRTPSPASLSSTAN
jgi:hypothetical protein